MTITPNELEARLKQAFPDSDLTVDAIGREHETHYAAFIKSPVFNGKDRLEQHHMVLDALGDIVKDIPSLSLQTIPTE